MRHGAYALYSTMMAEEALPGSTFPSWVSTRYDRDMARSLERTKRAIRIVPVLVGLALLASACASVSDDAVSTTEASPPITVLAASEEEGSTTTVQVTTSEPADPTTTSVPEPTTSGAPSTSVAPTTSSSTTAMVTSTTATSTTAVTPPTTATSTTAAASTTIVTSPPTTTVSGGTSGVLAIGDSVMQAASNKYCGTLPAAIGGLEIYDVEGMVSRQFGSAKGIVSTRIAQGRTPSVLIVHLGTNGPVSRSAFDALMAVAAPIPKVVFVTINVPRSHEGPSNDVLRSGVGRYSNAVLADWKAAAAGHPEYFSNEELFHLNCNPGAKAYAGVIAGKV